MSKLPRITVDQYNTLCILVDHLRYPTEKARGGFKRDVTLLERKGYVRHEHNRTDGHHIRVTALGFQLWERLGGDKNLPKET